MRNFYASAEGWQALSEAGELSVTDRLTNNPEVPLDDATRVRISVAMRRDAKRFVTVHAERWH